MGDDMLASFTKKNDEDDDILMQTDSEEESPAEKFLVNNEVGEQAAKLNAEREAKSDKEGMGSFNVMLRKFQQPSEHQYDDVRSPFFLLLLF